jgi:SAM-dependent methyltransferase
VSDPETIATYDARAAAYAEHFSNTAPDADLQAFIDALPDGGHVLDLGCGPAHSAAMMQRAGLCVTAWDASAEMVALARRLHGLRPSRKRLMRLNANRPLMVSGRTSVCCTPRAKISGATLRPFTRR